MELKYEGKTKNVYLNEKDNYVLEFKDDVTGVDGVFDPGANTVGLSIEGNGNKGLALTEFFFNYLGKKDIVTHFVSCDLDNNLMEVVPAKTFGNGGLEVICRLKATGSFIKRYGDYASEGQDLDYFVEVTLKSDDRNDPPISKECLKMLNIMSEADYDEVVKQTKQITKLVKEKLLDFDVVLYDIKFEFGKNNDGKIILIDEISGGNMRAYTKNEILEPMALSDLVLNK